MFYPKRPSCPMPTKARKKPGCIALTSRLKIKNILENKFRAKYISLKRPELEAVIQSELGLIMTSKNLNQSHVELVERKLNILSKSVNRLSNKSQLDCSGDSKNKEESNNVSCREMDITNLAPALSKSFECTELPPISNFLRKPQKKSKWDKIIDYKQWEYEQEMKQISLKEMEKKKKVRELLEKQIKDRIKAKEREKVNDDTINKMMFQIEQKELDEEERKINEFREKKTKEKKLRDQQVQGNKIKNIY